METSISLKTKAQDNTTGTTTLSYVNPNASNENLKLYAQKMASLTSDEYVGAVKVDKTDLDEETGTRVSREMALVIVPDSGDESIVTDGKAYLASMQAGAFYGVSLQGYQDCYANFGSINTEGSGVVIYGQDDSDSTGASFHVESTIYSGTVVKFYAPQTDTYFAATAEITIVGGE